MGLQWMRCVNAMSIRGFAVLDAQSCFSPLPVLFFSIAGFMLDKLVQGLQDLFDEWLLGQVDRICELVLP